MKLITLNKAIALLPTDKPVYLMVGGRLLKGNIEKINKEGVEEFVVFQEKVEGTTDITLIVPVANIQAVGA